LGSERKRLPGEAETERISLLPQAPRPKPALPAATPGAVRAALVFGGVMLAHLVLGLTQPSIAQSQTAVWAMLAFAAMAVIGLVGMYVERAEGFRSLVLWVQLVSGIAVVILDSIYWAGLVMG